MKHIEDDGGGMKPAIKAAIADAIACEDGNPAILTELVTSRVKIKPNAFGTPDVIVLDARGDPETTWRDGRPVPATIDDLVKGLKANPTYAPAFDCGSGAGKGSSGALVTTMSATDWLAKTSAATPTERTALFHEAAAGKFVIGG